MPSESDDFLHEIAKKAGLNTSFTTSTSAASSKGENFLGDIRSLTLTSDSHSVHVILKRILIDEGVAKQLPQRPFFDREIYVYEHVIPAFERILRDNDVQFSFSPKCYASCLTPGREALALGDLREEGFRLYDRLVQMDEEHVKLVLDTYAGLHGLGIAYREIKGNEAFEELVRPMKVDVFGRSRMGMKDAARKKLEKVEGLIHDEKVLGKLRKGMDEAEAFTFLQNVERSVIAHGDCWNNNMMFKYEESNKPTEMRLLDYQLSHASPPATDLSYFLFTCAPDSVLNNMQTYLEYYWESLRRFLKKFDIEAEKVYSLKAFLEDWKKYARIGFVNACMVIAIALAGREEAPDFGSEKAEDFENRMKNKDLVDERMKKLVYHMAENDLF